MLRLMELLSGIPLHLLLSTVMEESSKCSLAAKRASLKAMDTVVLSVAGGDIMQTLNHSDHVSVGCLVYGSVN